MKFFFLRIASGFKSAFRWATDPQNRTAIMFIAIIVLSGYIFYQHNKISNLETTVQVQQDNIFALTDSLRDVSFDKNRLIMEQGAFQATIGDLRSLNRRLADEVDSLRSNPLTITRIETRIERDTVLASNIEWDYEGDDVFRIGWDFEETGDWGERYISGYNRFVYEDRSTIHPLETVLLKDILEFNITTGFRRTDDGHFVAYASSTYPNLTFNVVDGAILDPSMFPRVVEEDRRRWGLGVQFGYGVNSNLDPDFFVGLGIQYSLINW